MNIAKELENKYKEQRVEYFKEKFLGKDFYTIIYDISRDITCSLTKFYIKLGIICDCLEVIKDEPIQGETKKDVYNTLESINCLKNDFEKYLSDISKGFKT